MTPDSFQPSAELVSLVSLQLDGTIDEASLERLQNILLEDDDACRWYDGVMSVHSMLLLDGKHDTLELPAKIVADGFDVPLPSSVTQGQESEDETKAESAQGITFGSVTSTFLRPPVMGIMLLLLVGVIYVAISGGDAPPARGKHLAFVKDEVGLRFAYGVDGNQSPKKGDSLRAGLYQILDGLVELEYASGARVLVMAPAEFRLIDEMRMELVDGRVAAEIPDSAVGFTVDTVGCSVVDLGTAFGVKAERGKSSDVHVFEGQVRVDLSNQDGIEDKPLQLLAGFASRLNPLSPIPAGIDMNDGDFVRNLGIPKDAYGDAVLSLDPVAYYRMEPEGDGRSLYDSSSSKAHATIHNAPSGSPWNGGKVGSALEFGGPVVQTFAMVEDYPKSKNNELTVVCWVYADSRPSWASIAKNWGNPPLRGQFHLGLLEHSGELAAHIADAKNATEAADDARQVCAQDTVPLPLHAWHHVVMVADGSMLRLYRNGEEVGSAAYSSLYESPTLKALAIGTKLNNAGDAPAHPGWSMWDGRLDELAIFNYALTQRQIQQLYQLSSQE